MKTIKKIGFVSAVAFAMLAFSACDDSLSASSDETGTSSSSVETSDLDESSSSVDKKSSGNESTEKDKSSSSVKGSEPVEVSSSSSKETKDSSDSKSSSSVKADDSSSSLSTCPPEKEGKTKMVAFTGVTYICTDGYWIEVSSSSAASSSSYFDTTKVFNPDIEYGFHTDSRDGRVYRTVTISLKFEKPDGRKTITVLAENLNYGKMITGGNTQSDSTKFCFDDDPWYCEHGFGGFYTWSNAMKFPSACDSVSLGSENCPSVFTDYTEELLVSGEDVAALYYKHQGICDDGWHIMNAGEWGSLAEIINGGSFYNSFGSAALAYSHLLPDNRFGLSLLPTGFYDFSKKMYKDRELYAYHWLPQEKASTTANYFSVSSSDYTRSYWGLKGGWALPIRCVKDY
jgi:uncharacterized protein (TIGR02145 family)